MRAECIVQISYMLQNKQNNWGFDAKGVFMERLIFSRNIQNRQCYRFMNFHDRDQYWFCPARYELIDKAI